MGTLALIGLGSNVGDREAHLDRAVAALAETPGVSVVAVSTDHETAPAGGPAGQGAFLNAAARLDTELDPLALLHVFLDIEARAGRVRTVRWGERPLDLDLLIYGCKTLQTPELTLPHPRLGVRRFVLAPLAEIAPDIVDMRSGLTMAQLLANLDRRPSYVAIDGPPGPLRDAVYRRLLAGLPSAGLAESEIEPGPGPDWLEDDDVRTHTRMPPLLKSRIRLLHSDRWASSLGEGRWLVSDFRLTPLSIAQERASIAVQQGQVAASRPHYDLLWVWSKERKLEPGSVLQHLRDWLLPTTFVVSLPGGSLGLNGFAQGRPWKGGEVTLMPDSAEPDGIAHEILAACAATRA